MGGDMATCTMQYNHSPDEVELKYKGFSHKVSCAEKRMREGTPFQQYTIFASKNNGSSKPRPSDAKVYGAGVCSEYLRPHHFERIEILIEDNSTATLWNNLLLKGMSEKPDFGKKRKGKKKKKKKKNEKE